MALTQEYRNWSEIGNGLAALALALRELGELEEAVNRLLPAIRVSLEWRSVRALLYVLPAAAKILVTLPKCERAVVIYELALQYPFVANAQLFEDVAGQEIASVAESLPLELAKRARQIGLMLDPWQTMADLLVEFY